MSKTVADVMTPDPIVVQPQTPLKEAIAILVENKMSGLPVVDDKGNLVGILAETDLMWQESGPDPRPYFLFLDSVIYLENPARYDKELHKALGQTVGEVMSEKPTTIKPDDSLRQGAKLLHEKNIRHLPVVDEEGQVIGMLTSADILRAMAEH